jgi:hypothetical protein
MGTAYRATQAQLATNQELRDLFYPQFLGGYRDFDELVPWFLERESNTESWKAKAEAFLRAKHYDDELAAEYTRTIAHFHQFFEQMSFLYAR